MVTDGALYGGLDLASHALPAVSEHRPEPQVARLEAREVSLCPLPL